MKAPKSGESKNERDIRRIMVAGTAIAFGCMTGSLEALRSSPGGFSFQISWRTFVAFVVGGLAVVPFWNIVFGLVSKNRTRSSHVRAAFLFLLVGIAAFLYPLRFVPKEKLPEVYTGLVIALCALSLVAALLVTIARFLEKDSENHEIRDKSEA